MNNKLGLYRAGLILLLSLMVVGAIGLVYYSATRPVPVSTEDHDHDH